MNSVDRASGGADMNTPDDMDEAYRMATAIFYQEDAAYTYKKSHVSRDVYRLAADWLAARIQESAAQSYARARYWMGIEEGPK